MIFAIPISVLALAAGAASAGGDKPDPFCAVLETVIAEAASRPEPVRIDVFTERSEDEVGGFHCQHDPNDAVQLGYCDAVFQTVGWESLHLYPWRVESCLALDGVRLTTALRDEDTHMLRRGKPMKQLVRLQARLRSQVDLDLQFTSDDAYGGHWFGHYNLVLWKPSA